MKAFYDDANLDCPLKIMTVYVISEFAKFYHKILHKLCFSSHERSDKTLACQCKATPHFRLGWRPVATLNAAPSSSTAYPRIWEIPLYKCALAFIHHVASCYMIHFLSFFLLFSPPGVLHVW